MPLTKSTGTVGGASNQAVMTVLQYGLRAEIKVPGKAVIAATHRASAGTTRTLTLASAHRMAVGDLFLFGNFSSASYNATNTAHLGVVETTPAANKLTFSHSTSFNESETAVTQGNIIRLGFRRLRIMMRFAIPRLSNWAIGSGTLGLGISRGAYPVSSNLCEGFAGVVVASNTYTFSGTLLSIGSGQNQYSKKVGASFGTYGLTTTANMSASRTVPRVWFLDYYRGGATTWSVAYGRSHTVGANGVQRQDMLEALRNPQAPDFGNQILPPLSVAGNTFDATTVAAAPLVFATGPEFPIYLEVFIRDTSQAMEIYDIGYAFFA